MPGEVVHRNATIIRVAALTAAAATVLILGSLFAIDLGDGETEPDISGLASVVSLTSGFVLVQQFAMNARLIQLLSALVTILVGLAAAILTTNFDGWGTVALASIGLSLLLGAVMVLIEGLPVGSFTLPPWLWLAAVQPEDGAVPFVLVATALGLITVVLTLHSSSAALTGQQAAGPTMQPGLSGTDQQHETTPVAEAPVLATAPSAVDFGHTQADDEDQVSEVPALGSEAEIDEAFAKLEGGDRPTVAIPRVGDEQKQSKRSRSALAPTPAPTAADSIADFHLVLGEPSRADGTPGELPMMPNPFTPGSEADHFTAGDWVLHARSSRGSSHVHGGEPRQDSYAATLSQDGKYVITAVADGLGSAKRSNFGSYWATRIATALLARDLKDGVDVAVVLGELTPRVASAMEKLASDLINSKAEDIAATLVVSVVPKDGPTPIWLARVGDSDAMVLTSSGQWASGFGAADDGALETGTTNVLPHHPDRVEVRTIDGSKARALLVATDGVARVIENSPDVVGSAFAERLSEPVDAIEFQRVVDFRRRGAHDDRTVVALWHRPGR